MGKLAASPDHLPQVLAELEAGQRLNVKQVVAIIGGEKDVPASDLPNAGGIAGLRANAQAKLKPGISDFARNVAEIMVHIETALAPAREGKRVLKGQRADKIERLARLTRFPLENVALFVELNPGNSAASQVVRFPEGSKWREVTELLWILGGRESWPRDDLAIWLSTDVRRSSLGRSPTRKERGKPRSWRAAIGNFRSYRCETVGDYAATEFGKWWRGR
jgi:hypothetical protein